MASIEVIGDYINSIKPDVLFLQEVDKNTERSFHKDQFKILKKYCGFNYGHFCRTVFFEDYGEYGLALYSKNDCLKNIKYINISVDNDKEPRYAICGEITLFENVIGNLFCVHLSNNKIKSLIQLEYLKKHYFLKPNSIFLGDFNLSTDEIEKLGFEQFDHTFSWPYPLQNIRIDHIFTTIKDCEYTLKTLNSNGLSDHSSVLIEL